MGCDMRISERGQITIPKALRERFGLNQNVEVEVVPTERGLLIQKRAAAEHPVDRIVRDPERSGHGMWTSTSRKSEDVDHRRRHERGAGLIELRPNRSARHTQSSGVASQRAYNDGAVAGLRHVVYAELVPALRQPAEALDGALRESQRDAVANRLRPSRIEAGMRWMRYRQAGRTAGANHGRLSDWGSCLGRRRHVSNPGSWLLCDVLSGVEDSAGVVPAHGLWARTCPEEAGLRPAPTKARPTNGITVS